MSIRPPKIMPSKQSLHITTVYTGCCKILRKEVDSALPLAQAARGRQSDGSYQGILQHRVVLQAVFRAVDKHDPICTIHNCYFPNYFYAVTLDFTFSYFCSLSSTQWVITKLMALQFILDISRAKVCIKSPWTVVWFSQIVYFISDNLSRGQAIPPHR